MTCSGPRPSTLGPIDSFEHSHIAAAMSTSEPLDLRLPTPSCLADAERSGLDADAVFDGMTEHLFFTLGKLAPTASRQARC